MLRKIPVVLHSSSQRLAQCSCLAFFSSQQLNTWHKRERRSLWAFPRKPFVDTAVIACRGRETEEGGGGRLARDLMALVGSCTSSELTGHSETTASLSWNIKLVSPVCVRDQNIDELHANASKQLPCCSRKGPKVVYGGNMILLPSTRVVLAWGCRRWSDDLYHGQGRTDRRDASYPTNLGLPVCLFVHSSTCFWSVASKSASHITQLPAVLYRSRGSW